MEEKEIARMEHKLTSASLMMTCIFDIAMLAAAWTLRGILDWRISVGLIVLSLILQFGFVMPGIRNICRGMRKSNDELADGFSQDDDENLEQGV